jgi:hypothetical protein
MKLSPSKYESQLSLRKIALDDVERVEPDFGGPIGVTGMEVRRPVIVEEHRDHYSEEAADRWHGPMFPRGPAESLRSTLWPRV